MDIAIIGGGASGLACAITAARKSKEVGVKSFITVYEANEKIGKKILTTGNGRCNLTNINICEKSYLGDTALASYVNSRFSAKSNIEFFKTLGLFTKCDSEGRVYPLSNQASGVLDALMLECERLKVRFVCDFKVENITSFKGKFNLGGGHFADKVVLASGGQAGIKKIKVYDLVQKLGIGMTDVVPSLTKLCTDTTYIKPLKGIRSNVKLDLEINNKLVASEVGEILFADYGLSGIAIMQLSAYITRHFVSSKTKPLIKIDFVPTFSVEELVEEIKTIYNRNKNIAAENLLAGFLPKKIGLAILKSINIVGARPIKDVNLLMKIAQTSKNFEIYVTGTKGFEDAQVSCGGVKTNEIDTKTLEVKKIKNLFICGELLNVDGLCGGFNLQFAWSSGRICGESLILGDKK